MCPQEGCRDNLVYFANLNNMNKEGCINSTLKLSQVVYEFKHDYEVRMTCILLLDAFGFLYKKIPEHYKPECFLFPILVCYKHWLKMCLSN